MLVRKLAKVLHLEFDVKKHLYCHKSQRRIAPSFVIYVVSNFCHAGEVLKTLMRPKSMHIHHLQEELVCRRLAPSKQYLWSENALTSTSDDALTSKLL